MKKIKIAVGTHERELSAPDRWEDLSQSQFLFVVSHMPQGDSLPYDIMRHLLSLSDEERLFLLPVHLFALHRDFFHFLDDYSAIKRWLVSDITLADGRHCLPPAADFDNVSWEEFVFADQLAQLGNWGAVAACLFRPTVPNPSEDADPRVPFSRVGTTNRLPLFKQLDPTTILAVQINYLALRSHLTDHYRHLFSSHPAAKGQPSSSWPKISQSLLGEDVWNEQQLFRTSVSQVLFRLDNIIVQSLQNKSRHA